MCTRHLGAGGGNTGCSPLPAGPEGRGSPHASSLLTASISNGPGCGGGPTLRQPWLQSSCVPAPLSLGQAQGRSCQQGLGEGSARVEKGHFPRVTKPDAPRGTMRRLLEASDAHHPPRNLRSLGTIDCTMRIQGSGGQRTQDRPLPDQLGLQGLRSLVPEGAESRGSEGGNVGAWLTQPLPLSRCTRQEPEAWPPTCLLSDLLQGLGFLIRSTQTAPLSSQD